MPNPLRTLNEYGQSVWLDFVSRDLLKRGFVVEMPVEAVGAAHIHGVPFDYAQGRLSTSFGWRLTSLRMTSELGWNVCRSLRSR